MSALIGGVVRTSSGPTTTTTTGTTATGINHHQSRIPGSSSSINGNHHHQSGQSSSTSLRKASIDGGLLLGSSTDVLREQLESNINQLNQSLLSRPPGTVVELSKQLVDVIQTNNQLTLNFIEGSFQRVLSSVLDSIHTQQALDHCHRQLAENQRESINNATNLNEQVRNRVSLLLYSQKQELENERRNLLKDHHHFLSVADSTSKLTTTRYNTTDHQLQLQDELNHPHPLDNSNVHPTLLNNSRLTPTSILVDHRVPASLTTYPLSDPSLSHKRSRELAFEYDESLIEGFTIPNSCLDSQQQSCEYQEPISDISVMGGNLVTASTSSTNPSAAVLEHCSPKTSGNKSSRRQSWQDFFLSVPGQPVSMMTDQEHFPSTGQSAVLRNLVSAALGKLIAQVTNNQQTHWPGSDTEERLAAIGLEIELWNGSKLTKDILHKGPKNLQLQQCKRILLELELGLIKLKEIKAVPRPSRLNKKQRMRNGVVLGGAGGGGGRMNRNLEANCEENLGIVTDPCLLKDNHQDLIQRYIQSSLHPNQFGSKNETHHDDDDDDDEAEDERQVDEDN